MLKKREKKEKEINQYQSFGTISKTIQMHLYLYSYSYSNLYLLLFLNSTMSFTSILIYTCLYTCLNALCILNYPSEMVVIANFYS